MNAFSVAQQIQTPPTTNPNSMDRSGARQKPDESIFETHFNLHRQPFSSAPNPDNYFAAATIENARESLVRLIQRENGPAIVVGPVGIGKTLLSQLISESFRHRCRVVQLPNARLSSRLALLQMMLYELGLPYRDLDESEARLAVIDHVTNRDACPHGIVLLVDEAENLSMALLDELRTMTNLTSDGRALIQLTLFGNRRLEEKFAHPRLESFNQRLAGRFYLEALTQEEVKRYIHQQIRESGGDPTTIFTEDAIQSVTQATEGIPRLVNQLCSHALYYGATNALSHLDCHHISDAWADLQQLPTPSQSGFQASDSESLPNIVEFGQLDDSQDTEVRCHTPAEEFEVRSETTLTETKALPVVDDAAAPIASEDWDERTQIETVESPEIELIFHDSATTIDPFNEPFEEEELIVDDYLMPSLLAEQHRSVSCDESHELAEHLSQILSQAIPTTTVDSEPTESTNNREDNDSQDEELESGGPEILSFALPLDRDSESEPETDALTGDVEIQITPEPTGSGPTNFMTERDHPVAAEELDAHHSPAEAIGWAEAMHLEGGDRPSPTTTSLALSPTEKISDTGQESTKADRDIYRNLFTRLRLAQQ